MSEDGLSCKILIKNTNVVIIDCAHTEYLRINQISQRFHHGGHVTDTLQWMEMTDVTL